MAFASAQSDLSGYSDRIWEALSTVYNMADVPDEAKSIIGDVMLGLGEPSAQPEIVRCKDCKHWMPHSQLGYDEDNETYHDYCEKLIPEDEYYAFYRDADDYCSRAERRAEKSENERLR